MLTLMTTGSSDFQRARRPEQKQQRHDAILAAARELALRDGVRAVSLADIAAEVGIHKSALLRYFETREEIFLRLNGEAWREWADALEAAFAGEDGPERLAHVLATSLAERPLMCDLLTHAPLNLERNVSVDAARAFKLDALGAVERIALLAGRVVPGLDEAAGRDLVTAVTAFASTLWQISHPTPTLATLYAEDPRLAHAAVDFAPRVERLTGTVIAGLLARRAGA
jgi:AcrR family transcriptional regulator